MIKGTSSATAWSALDILIRQLLSFGISIVLARLLTPADFGTVALASFFSTLLIALLHTGLSTALIRRRDATREEESAVFWWCLGASIVAGAALLTAAPLIAAYFAQPVLGPLMAMAAGQLVFAAIGVVPTAMLTRALDIRPLTIAGIIASLVSGAIGIGAALVGAGVWAIALQLASASFVNSVALWFVSDWRPTTHWHFATLRALLGFSTRLSASGALDIVYTYGFALVVGKLHGTADLGLYNRAQGTQQLPGNVVAMMLARLMLPIFAASNDDPLQQLTDVRAAVRAAMLVNLPAMVVLALLADLVVLVMFGPKWLGAARVLAILAVGGALIPLHVINLQLLLAQDRADRFLKIEMAKKLAGITCVVIGSLFGIIGLAISQAVFNVLAFVMNAYFTRQTLAYGVLAQLRDLLPIALLSLIVGTVIMIARRLIDLSPALELFGLLSVGGLTYLLLALPLAHHFFPGFPLRAQLVRLFGGKPEPDLEDQTRPMVAIIDQNVPGI